MSRWSIVAAAGAVAALAAVPIGWQREVVHEAASRRETPGSVGASLFRAKGCASCHDGPGSTAFVPGFPSLADPGSWAGERKAGLSAGEYLAESIREPSAYLSPELERSGGPTQSMPELGLSNIEIDAIVTYLLAD